MNDPLYPEPGMSFADALKRAFDDPKLLKRIAAETPVAYRTFFHKKYILPTYRQPDYAPQKWQNIVDYDRVCTFAAGAAPTRDEPWMTALANVVAGLRYNRPTLFLERELGEALLRTNVIEHLTTSDIHWRWPAFRIYLPSELIAIKRGDKIAWATHFDVSEISSEGGQICPRALALELDNRWGTNMLQRTDFFFKERGIIITTALNEPEIQEIAQTTYSLLKPWGQITLTQYFAIKDELSGGVTQDDTDRTFLRKLEHVVLNTLLFMSELPEEYQGAERPETIRAGNTAPNKLQSELMRARFVGDLSVRRMRELTAREPRATGKHKAAHWVSGHWRRQAYGQDFAQHKLIWIAPYTTYEAQTGPQP